jgi:hypothetical protein
MSMEIRNVQLVVKIIISFINLRRTLMVEKLCKNCDNYICKDMYPIMQKEYIKQCLNSNRSCFVSHKERTEKENK